MFTMYTGLCCCLHSRTNRYDDITCSGTDMNNPVTPVDMHLQCAAQHECGRGSFQCIIAFVDDRSVYTVAKEHHIGHKRTHTAHWTFGRCEGVDQSVVQVHVTVGRESGG